MTQFNSIQIDLGSPVDKELSARVQRCLFAIGIFWPGGIRKVTEGTSRYLYIHRGKIQTRHSYSLAPVRKLTGEGFIKEVKAAILFVETKIACEMNGVTD